MLLNSTCSLVACALVVSSSNSAFAQAQPKPAVNVEVQSRANKEKPDGHRHAGQINDQSLATCVALDNQEEIAIAKFAQSHTKNEKVKKFAEMLVTDHQAFLKKLEKFSPEASNDLLKHQGDRDEHASQDRAAQDKGVQTAGAQQADKKPAIQQTSNTESTRHEHKDVGFMQLHKELAAQCLADSKENLSSKKAEEFDACFVGMQIAKHAGMKTKLTVLQRHSGDELAALLKEGAAKTQQHMEHAEQLMHEIAKADKSSTTAQRE